MALNVDGTSKDEGRTYQSGVMDTQVSTYRSIKIENKIKYLWDIVVVSAADPNSDIFSPDSTKFCQYWRLGQHWVRTVPSYVFEEILSRRKHFTAFLKVGSGSVVLILIFRIHNSACSKNGIINF